MNADMFEGWGLYSAEQEAEDRKALDGYRRTWSAWNFYLAKTDRNPGAHICQRRHAVQMRAEAADMIQTMEDLLRISVAGREERAAL